MDKIYIEESYEKDGVHWILSYDKPAFQGGKYIEIDEETATGILEAKHLLAESLTKKE